MNYQDSVNFISNEKEFDLNTRYQAATLIGDVLRTNSKVAIPDKMDAYGYWKLIHYINNPKEKPKSAPSRIFQPIEYQKYLAWKKHEDSKLTKEKLQEEYIKVIINCAISPKKNYKSLLDNLDFPIEKLLNTEKNNYNKPKI